MINSLRELIERFKLHPNVIGLVRYGRRTVDDMSPGGDFDLFVIVKERPSGLESVHFHIEDITVDINFRTLKDLQSEHPITRIDINLASGEVLWVKFDALKDLLPKLSHRWKAEASFHGANYYAAERFFQTHALYKVRGRLRSEPLFCNFILSTDIFWLVETFFRVRQLTFPGEKSALEAIRKHEPEIFCLIEEFYATNDVSEKYQIVEKLTDLVLEPIGGAWEKGEFLSLATSDKSENIQIQGRIFLKDLLDIKDDDFKEA